MSQATNETILPCSECQAGHLHRRYLTYFTWLGEELITVPDFPAWVCDVCGKRDYDMHALGQLNLLLTPNAGKTLPRARRANHIEESPKTARPSKRS